MNTNTSISSSLDLDDLIGRLDAYLLQGFLLKRSTWYKYDTESKKDGYEQPALLKEFEDNINKWLNEVDYRGFL